MLCGIARRTINPEPGHHLAGYGQDYPNDGVHDDISVTALYLADGNGDALLLSFDLIGMCQPFVKDIRHAVANRAGVPAPVDTRPPRWVRGDAALGERIYAASCAGCHGAKGEGGDGPALNNPVLQQLATDTYLTETVARGRRGTAMGGFLEPSTVRRTLAREEIEAVVTFIRSWGGRL